ncbi:MAG: fasciclin domain-containing protein [Hyphomonadaceae bacterium]|nr:fasciclin domain-containing protein [Hyphomonadaceae bacterium]
MKNTTRNSALIAISALALLGGCAATEHASANSGHAAAHAAAPAAATQTTIVGAAAASPDHTTLVAAVQAAGLVETLSGPGPFTVFAPTNAAFGKLPAGTVDTLVRPENRATLTRILTYHVVAGRVTASELIALIQAGGGRATLTTVQGGTLTATLNGSTVTLTDAAGGTSQVTAADLIQSNGVIHVIDTVVMPPQA